LLSLDLVQLSLQHQIQKAIIIDGDSDYVPAIQLAKNAGVVVTLCYFERLPDSAIPDDKGFHIHDELKDVCDEWISIDQTFIDEVKV